MNTAAIYIKTEPKLKKQAQKVAKELGLSLGAVLNAYLKELIVTKTVTFSRRDEIPNKRTAATLRKAEENYKKGNTSPVFDNAKDAIAWLHQDHKFK